MKTKIAILLGLGIVLAWYNKAHIKEAYWQAKAHTQDFFDGVRGSLEAMDFGSED